MKLEIFTLCEYANADPMSGKINIVGTFDHVANFQVPIVIPFCAIAFRLRLGVIEAGMKKCRLSFIDADGTSVMPTMEFPVSVQVRPGESTTIVPFVAIAQQIKLPHFGEYAIALAIDGNEVGSIPLFAKQIQLPPQMQKPPQQPPQSQK